MRLKQFLQEHFELNEKLITLAGKAYPKFGNVVIMAGGAGSGKGFIQNNLLGVQGSTFDVDELKKAAIKSKIIRKTVKKELDYDLKDFEREDALKDPEVVSKLHDIIGGYLKLNDRKMQAMMTSALLAAPDRKPNMIFDVTLRDLQKFDNITRMIKEVGYDPKKIHIVWVVNDVEVAAQQNLKRSRVVKPEILMNTHKGVSRTMNDIVNMGQDLSKYMDGDIVFAFNKVGVDSVLIKSERGGKYVAAADFVYVKRSGKGVISVKEMDKRIKDKIKSYIPQDVPFD